MLPALGPWRHLPPFVHTRHRPREPETPKVQPAPSQLYCPPCEVLWSAKDQPSCWNCGADGHNPKEKR